MQFSKCTFILELWIYFCTLIKAQEECDPKLFPLTRNTEPPQILKDSYKQGESVRLSCQIGYVGYVRLTCNKSVWEISQRKCEAKQCGHPGDTLNGHFELIEGDDFVFGSQVQYTCKKGYVMASRMNYRSCMDEGWDNVVPICEVVKCAPIQSTEGLLITGKYDEAQFSDVVQFECQSENQKLNGPNQIYCTDSGQWSGPIPKCEEIRCEYPEIPHSIAENTRMFFKNKDILRIECETGYVPAGRPSSTCTNKGWVPQPVCREYTCSVPHSNSLKVESFGLSAYKDGEQVKYTCKDGYRKTEEFATCTLQGWIPLQMCGVRTCTLSRKDKILLSYDEQLTYQVGRWSYFYACQPGYKKMANYAQCKNEGWEPRELCKAIKTECTKPNLKEGYFSSEKENYRTEEIIYYACNPKYKPSKEGWWGEITCKEGIWSETPQCISEMNCGVLSIAHSKHRQATEYVHGSIVQVECETGYTLSKNTAKCLNGNWELPLPICTQIIQSCDAPPRVDHAVINSEYLRKYMDNYKVRYQCQPLFRIKGDSEIICRNGTWSTPPRCVLSKCTNPERFIPNATLKDNYYAEYDNGTSIQYQCEDSLIAPNGTQAICIDGIWKYSQCIKKDYCDTPELKNGQLIPNKEKYSDGEVLEYSCFKPFDFFPNGKAICQGGKWNQTFKCEGNGCLEEPEVENGDIVSRGSGVKEVTYQCKKHYKIQGSSKVKCQDGKWSEPPKCLSPCTIEETDTAAHNLENPQNKFLGDGETYTVKCKTGYVIRNSVRKALCNKGIMFYPTCLKSTK